MKDSKAKGSRGAYSDQFSIRKVYGKQEMDRFLMRPMSPYQMKLGDKNTRERMQLSCKFGH